jgi:GrpB-like predicted nucleotidyltransferase (UPF0157 family)
MTGNIDESVRLVPYSDEWPRRFGLERDRLAAVLGISHAAIEHIGSTAVPGLLSKPVVDMMLGLGEYPPPTSCIDALIALGYEDFGEAGVPQRRYLRRRGTTDFNLHAVTNGGDHWSRNIALRNYLRSSDSAKARYTSAKQHAIRAGASTLLHYSEAKAGVIADLLREAMQPGVCHGRP